MKKVIFSILFSVAVLLASAQNNIGVGTETPHASSILELNSTTQGFLAPRMKLEEIQRIQNPAIGLIVYQTDFKEGLYINSKNGWVAVSNSVSADPNDWSLLGNSNVTSNNFIGTINNVDLEFRRNNLRSGLINYGQGRTFFGDRAGLNSIGTGSTAYGASTLGALGSGNTGNFNVAIGFSALSQNTSGASNMALGAYAMRDNLTGTNNLAIGTNVLRNKISGSTNVGIGSDALLYNLTGSDNVAIGTSAGGNNNGSSNIFIGRSSGQNEDGSNKLYLANSNTPTPLIYGDFSARFISIGNVPVEKRNSVASSGQYSLIVEKGILSEKLKVALKSSADWADYVFEPEYKSNMLSLEEVEKFTLENKHLPNVPSAKELVEKGLDFNETSRIFMEKIEELTLYLIELNKEVKALKAENEVLKKILKK